MQRRILIVEDDRDLAALARLHLEDHGFAVQVEHDGDAGLHRAVEQEFDLVLLDLMLPGLDGLEICRRLRNRERYVPLMILTARDGEVDRILGLEIGADDYLTKPFSLRELVARVRALFRRVEALGAERAASVPQGGEIVRRGELELDVSRRRVRLAGRTVELTAKEFDLLLHFARRPGRVFTRSELVDAVWGPGYDGYEHTVNSHINRLRRKVDSDGARQRYIETVWGVGYRFCEEEQA